MRFSTVATVVAATAGLAAAQPHHAHKHAHQAAHARRQALGLDGTNVITIYMLNGHEISAQDVQAGLANGTLEFASNGAITSAKPAAPAPTPVVIPSSAPAPAPKPNTAAAPVQASDSASIPLTKVASTAGGALSFLQGTGVSTAFPDGKLSCSDFPVQYGAISLEYLGLGGWSGIQLPGSNNGGYSDIETVVASSCSGSDCCSEGAFCSYACPAGFQKAQWPSTQGATGQSVGGIQCRGGKLWLTNSAQPNLCMAGSSAVPIFVKNTMSKQSAICRTDYPGTESETIPLSAQPGTTTSLTCPDGDNYYQWEGKITSAQYYVNPSDVSIQDGCQWGSPSGDLGNYAPLNLGVGYSAGSAWLSIFQNAPTTNAKLDYTIEIVGTNGGYDNLAGRCRYSNGQYCSGDSYEICSSTGAGCTVAVNSGSATFVLSN